MHWNVPPDALPVDLQLLYMFWTAGLTAGCAILAQFCCERCAILQHARYRNAHSQSLTQTLNMYKLHTHTHPRNHTLMLFQLKYEPS
jgi:hypothetical protein